MLEISSIFGVPVIEPRSFVRVDTLPDDRIVIVQDRQLFIDTDIRYHLACAALSERGINKLAKAITRARAFLTGLLMMP